MRLVPVTNIGQWLKIRRLYRTAFPVYERKPLGLVRRTQKRGGSDVWCIEDDGRFVGFAITMNTNDLVLMDYFAIKDEVRGRGIGSESLRMLQQQYADKRFFLEIESIYEDVPNLEERKRRKKFYLSNGMTEMKLMANVFGTNMELLGYQCKVDFAEYCSLYANNYGKDRAKRLIPVEYPQV